VVNWWRERFGSDIGLLAAVCVPQRSDRHVPAEAGHLKQGAHSVGIQRQYSGSAGKIANIDGTEAQTDERGGRSRAIEFAAALYRQLIQRVPLVEAPTVSRGQGSQESSVIRRNGAAAAACLGCAPSMEQELGDMAYNKIDQNRELMRAVAGWRTERWAELAAPTPGKRTLTEAAPTVASSPSLSNWGQHLHPGRRPDRHGRRSSN
jgi:hypothetical protein